MLICLGRVEWWVCWDNSQNLLLKSMVRDRELRCTQAVKFKIHRHLLTELQLWIQKLWKLVSTETLVETTASSFCFSKFMRTRSYKISSGEFDLDSGCNRVCARPTVCSCRSKLIESFIKIDWKLPLFNIWIWFCIHATYFYEVSIKSYAGIYNFRHVLFRLFWWLI